MSEKNIKVGARVELTGKELFGTIAYVGMTSFAVGKWVGVVLDEPKGKNSGSIKGQQYFQCDENCGMFVRPTQLRVVTPAGGADAPSSGGSGSATPTAAPTRARLSGSRTSLSSSRQSLLGSRTQLTTSLSERTGSTTSLATRKSLAPQSSKDKDKDASSSEAGPAPSSAATSSKRASFVETGFLEILKPQFTPSQPMRSPSFTTPPNTTEDKVALLEAQKVSAELQTQLADVTEKLETLKQRRNEDKERLREFDKMKIQFEQLQEFRTKIMAAQASLQKELQRAKQEAKDALEAKERHAQEMAELSDSVEMITLDKEMAEEKADTLQLELESSKERIEELQVDLELLRSEMQNKAESNVAASEGGEGGGMSTYEFKQLEQQNIRLKDTLVRLRDLTAHDKHDIQKLTKELEMKRSEVAELERTKEKLSSKIDELEATVADLQVRRDNHSLYIYIYFCIRSHDLLVYRTLKPLLRFFSLLSRKLSLFSPRSLS